MLALVVSVPVHEVELASDMLWSLGVVAVEERAGLAEDVELWTSLGDDASVVEHAMADSTLAWRLVEVDETVAQTWRAHAVPTWVDEDLVVVPSWLPVDPLVQQRLDADDAIIISIEPGSTFGAGDHPTTVVTMRAMRRLMTIGVDVLDVGCGSGVLSVAAAMLGARSAVGIDISPASVEATTTNAAGNAVGSTVQVSTTPLADVSDTFDVVLANILAPALIQLADDLRRVLRPDGTLVISGVLVDGFDHVVAALAPLTVVQVDQMDGWAAVSLRR